MRRRATSGEMARGGFWFGGFFCGWTGSRCGGMCWPRERQHEGLYFFCFGGFFHTLGSGWHEGGWFLFFLGGCSGVGGGFFHTLRRDGAPPCGGAGEEVFVLGDSFTRPGATDEDSCALFIQGVGGSIT